MSEKNSRASEKRPSSAHDRLEQLRKARKCHSNLGRLIDAGHLRTAMELAVELMKDGSRQVEASDEGMMTEDIEDCLGVVIKALKKADLPPGEIVVWCSSMLAADRVGFIADKELETLRSCFQKRE